MAVSAQSDRQSYKIAIGLLLFIALLYAVIPRNSDLRDFDPQTMAQLGFHYHSIGRAPVAPA